MADLTLYHIAPSRCSVALWMLEEIGEPYDIHLLSLTKSHSSGWGLRYFEMGELRCS
jgi:hypothetical protein